MSRLRLVSNYEVMQSQIELLAGQDVQLEHIHSVQKTKPTLANSFVLTGGVAAWGVGAKLEIFAANEVTHPFDIHWVGLGNVSDVGAVYEIILYSGLVGAEVEIGHCRVFRQANQAGTAPCPMMTPLLPANTRISAACASTNGGSKTIEVAFFYHEYI